MCCGRRRHHRKPAWRDAALRGLIGGAGRGCATSQRDEQPLVEADSTAGSLPAAGRRRSRPRRRAMRALRLHRLAPHLARRRACSSPGRFAPRLRQDQRRLWAFDRLASVVKDERLHHARQGRDAPPPSRSRPRGRIRRGPLLRVVTDDARLVTEWSSGAALGCVAATGRGDGLRPRRGPCGGRAGARPGLRRRADRARSRVVNAAGPWVDGVRIMGEPGEQPRLRLTKGITSG